MGHKIISISRLFYLLLFAFQPGIANLHDILYVICIVSSGIDRKSTSRGQGRGAPRGATNSSKGGTSDMKKAFTSAFSSFTDKLKNKMEGTESDDLETMSIRTDTSDDDFEHLSLDDFGEEVPAFMPHDPPSMDTASVNDNYSDLGDPGDSISMYAESSTTKGKEMVST